jgi:SagB-type dehydrogenase family enzyme
MNLERGMSAAAILHRLTRHGAALNGNDRELLVAFRPLDPSNRPVPFKRYAGREPMRLTRDLTLSSAPAASVLSGAPRGVGEGPWDEERLAQLLFLSNGVSRVSRSVFGETTYFRTAMSAGNLHPIEIYVACGDLDGVPAGIHHFAPLEFGRTELRRGDFRDALAAAAADPRVAEAPVTLVVTGIPWRTAWKYGERGFRHLYWDAGTMLANLLALEPSASVRVGFADQPVSRLIGVDGVSEFPLVLVVLDGSDTGGHREAEQKVGAVEPLDLAVEAMSRAPIEFPLATAAQRDGDLADATAVKQWRAAASSLGTPALVEVNPPTSASDDPIETVILRRGSTRLMRHETVGRELLTWGLGIAVRAVPGDVASDNDATLLQHFVSVHDVEGVASGSYRLRGGRLEHGREGQPRDVAAHLCFDQPLGGDSAYTVFHAADLDEVLGVLGSRGYRAAQLEAGIAAGRLALGAFALGYGATGLTFYDEAVSQHFGTQAACMLVTSVGVPAYRNAPGGPPGVPTPLARFDQLMERLSIQLRRGGL